MPYTAKLSTSAVTNVERFKDDFGNCIEENLRKLEEDPEELGRPATCPPYPPVGLVYHFKCRKEGRVNHFTAFFAYGPGDNEIGITGLVRLPTG